jgi:hypothetical protein
MEQISARRFCELLYCAIVPIDAFFGADSGHIRFTARSTEKGRDATYSAEFTGVRDFTRKQDTECEPEPGDLLELSVVELEPVGSVWRVWFNAWYVEQIEFQCEQIFIDDVEVSKSGRWLQDTPPTGTDLSRGPS